MKKLILALFILSSCSKEETCRTVTVYEMRDATATGAMAINNLYICGKELVHIRKTFSFDSTINGVRHWWKITEK